MHNLLNVEKSKCGPRAGERVIAMVVEVVCLICGLDFDTDCPMCSGTGKVAMEITRCGSCDGAGVKESLDYGGGHVVCHDCNGSGFNMSTTEVNMTLGLWKHMVASLAPDMTAMEMCEAAYTRVLKEMRGRGGLRPSHHFHDLDTVEHIEKVVTEARRCGSDKHIMAAMMHDLGKLSTAVQNEDGGYSFPKHDVPSAELAERCGCPADVVMVVGTHSWLYNIQEIKASADRKAVETGKWELPKSFRKFVDKLEACGPDTVSLYLDLALFDSSGFSDVGCEARMRDISVFQDMLQHMRGSKLITLPTPEPEASPAS